MSDLDPPPPFPVDADRGRAVLQAYGAYTADHRLEDDAVRILADLCAALAHDEPGLDREDLWSRGKEAADDRG